MAGKNRTELVTEVDNKIVPTVTNATHRDLLNNDIIESAVLRKDVISAATPSGGSVVVDFSIRDLATISITGNLSVTFLNLENGDVKYLSITKQAGNQISFPGAVDVSLSKDYITANALTVIYEVSNKNSLISVVSKNISATLDNSIIEQPWIAATNLGTWTVDETIMYRKNLDGSIQLKGEISGRASGTVLTLPSGFRPSYTRIKPIMVQGTYTGGGTAILAVGLVFSSSTGVVDLFSHPEIPGIKSNVDIGCTLEE